MEPNNTISPFSNALKYTLFISVLYSVYLFLDVDAPQGTEFFSYIMAKILTDIIVFVFPVLLLFFYFRDDGIAENAIDNLLNKNNPDIKEMNKQGLLREYHTMLQEGILTQEEFDTIKKRHLKDITIED